MKLHTSDLVWAVKPTDALAMKNYTQVVCVGSQTYRRPELCVPFPYIPR